VLDREVEFAEKRKEVRTGFEVLLTSMKNALRTQKIVLLCCFQMEQNRRYMLNGRKKYVSELATFNSKI